MGIFKVIESKFIYCNFYLHIGHVIFPSIKRYSQHLEHILCPHLSIFGSCNSLLNYK